MTHIRTTRDLDAFDVLFKNFFNNDSFFSPVIETRIGHPVDIFEDETGLHFEIAGTGLTKEDINISVEGDVLKVSYKREDSEDGGKKFFHRGITRKSFDLGYRIPLSRFDISNAEAEMENGLLRIDIPIAEAAKPKTLTIK